MQGRWAVLVAAHLLALGATPALDCRLAQPQRVVETVWARLTVAVASALGALVALVAFSQGRVDPRLAAARDDGARSKVCVGVHLFSHACCRDLSRELGVREVRTKAAGRESHEQGLGNAGGGRRVTCCSTSARRCPRKLCAGDHKSLAHAFGRRRGCCRGNRYLFCMA